MNISQTEGEVGGRGTREWEPWKNPIQVNLRVKCSSSHVDKCFPNGLHANGGPWTLSVYTQTINRRPWQRQREEEERRHRENNGECDTGYNYQEIKLI